jgi:PAS domain S-box-containing protein
MKIHSYQEKIIQAVVLSFISALFLLITGIVIVFITEVNELLTFSTFFLVFINQPILWLLAVLVILFPIITYLVYIHLYGQIEKKQKDIDTEHSKSLKITEFILKIIRQDFASTYEIDNEDDKLGKSLIELRDTLKLNQENVEKRRKEDEIRSWHAEGLAKFGDILRRNNDNINDLGYNIVKELTEYVGGIQGGFYLLNQHNEDDKFFELIAFYAYGRKKYADKQIKWGKGLIGTSAIERKTIYISDLPNTYISVTSGLGKANPKCVVISPLIANNELFGIIEIASFKLMEKYEINFIEKVAENTASILSTVKMNMQTSRLLEESKIQSQTLVSQEEEMRQNLEELQATQEEATRQSERFLRLETTVNHTMVRAEYTIDGTLIYANTRFLRKLEYSSNSDVEGKHISMFISKKDEEWFKRIWTDLSSGGRHFEGYMKHVTRTGKDLWTMATYTCIRDENQDVERILFLALDTTEHKKLSLSLEGIVDAVNRSGIKIEFDVNGNIKEFNDHFIYLFKYPEKEVLRLTVFDLIDNLELELFNKKWENVVSGMNFHGQFKVKTKTDEEKWIRGAFSVVYDMYGDVAKVVYIGNDITNEKLMEIESKKQNEILKKQEKLLRESEKELSKKLKAAKMEMQEQFKEIEHIKIRNERTLEGAIDAIITTSHDNRIIFFNQAAVKLLKYSKNEVMGKPVEILFPAKSIDEDDFISKYTGSGDNKIIGKRKEVTFKTKDGDEIPVLILLSKAQVEMENTYTAFIQTIEVEFF